MYPVEHYMKVLIGYAKKKYQLEASIVERYVAEEATEFCSEYIETGKPVGLLESFHDGRWEGRGTRGYNVVTMGHQEVSQVHLYILNNTTEVLPYINTHKTKSGIYSPKNEHDEGVA